MAVLTPDRTHRSAVLTVESRGVEPVSATDRHGGAGGQFSLWLGANLTVADFALGFLPVTLGLSWPWLVAAVLAGNLMGALALAVCTPMGPAYGLPQMVLTRDAFGAVAGRLPALLNYLSTVGWFTVNTILGAFGLRLLWPSLGFAAAAVLLVVAQGLLAVYGHNLVHAYERAMSVVLGVLFAVVTVVVLTHSDRLAQWQAGETGNRWAVTAIVVGATLSYVGSWSPYAADYSRYLPTSTSRGRMVLATFGGAFLASVWLELLGAGVAVLAGARAGDPLQAVHAVLGGWGGLGVLAIVLGATAANALNLYSNALTAGAVGVRLPRWLLAVVASGIGLALALLSSGSFSRAYEDFLLLLGYWFAPWLAVQVVDFYRRSPGERGLGFGRAVSPPAVVAFVLGVAVEVPFMSTSLWTGPVAARLAGADLSLYVGAGVAALVMLVGARPPRQVAVTP